MTRVAKAVVKMILINLDAYTIEKAKAYSRIRLSKKSVRKLS